MGAGAVFMMLTQSSGNDSPVNGGRPVKSSYKMAPSDQMSVRASTLLADRICSGDM
jgi:hypothetical protein